MHISTNPAKWSQRPALIFVLFIILFMLIKAWFQWQAVLPRLLSGDNDDIMRLMSVRDWLNGQSWFDMTQYRILPPEGVSIHWSRYVDLGIATVLVPLSKIMPMAQAEQWTLVIWPTTLMIVLILIVARGTDRILGPLASCGAVASLITWLPIGHLYFEAGRIDHHNVQILAITVLALAIAWPGDPIRRGIVAGVAAAFSLAVGLEMLPLVITCGLILLVRSAFEREGANRLMAAFCIALTGASVIFFIGQTAPPAWGDLACDKLSPPVIALIGIACASSLVPMAARRWLGHPAARLVASAMIAGIGVWLCTRLLVPCLDGPYGALPLDLQIMIGRDITEAQPSLIYALRYPISFHSFITPALVAFVISAVLWLRRRGRPDISQVETAAVAQMLVIAGLGIAGSLFQLRMITLATSAVPFLTGYAIRCLVQYRQQNPSTRSSLILVMGVLMTIFAAQLNGPAVLLIEATKGDAVAKQLYARPDDDCRTSAQLKMLNDLPRATILTAMDMAASMILTTHHSAAAAPYHRSTAGMWNGTFPMNDLADMRTALQTSGATYVVLCRETVFGPTRVAAHALLAGDVPEWLRPVPFDSDDFLIFAVIPEALAQ
jgi:hypothetical protein